MKHSGTLRTVLRHIRRYLGLLVLSILLDRKSVV